MGIAACSSTVGQAIRAPPHGGFKTAATRTSPVGVTERRLCGRARIRAKGPRHSRVAECLSPFLFFFVRKESSESDDDDLPDIGAPVLVRRTSGIGAGASAADASPMASPVKKERKSPGPASPTRASRKRGMSALAKEAKVWSTDRAVLAQCVRPISDLLPVEGVDAVPGRTAARPQPARRPSASPFSPGYSVESTSTCPC